MCSIKTNAIRFLSFFVFFCFFVCSFFFVSYNEKIESNLWFDSFSREKQLPPLLFRRCLPLLLGREGSVFLDSWCVITSSRIGWQTISGGRCDRGGYGNVCEACLCICPNFLGEFPCHLNHFLLFLPQNLFVWFMFLSQYIEIPLTNLYVVV